MQTAPMLPHRTTPTTPGQNPAGVYLASLAASGRRSMDQCLRRITKIVMGEPIPLPAFPWHMLRHEHTMAIRTALAEQCKSHHTANTHLAALRGTLRAAWRLGAISSDDFARAIDIPAVRGHSLPRGRALTAAEIRALFQACADDPSLTGRRDAALLALLYGAGLRRAEAVGLTMQDVDMGQGMLTVRGKGNRERLCHITNGVFDAMASWIETRGTEPGALLQPIRKGGEIQRRHMNTQSIYDALRHRARQACVAHFSPHDLRRTHISDVIDSTGDVIAAQRSAGHTSLNTTAQYDRRPDDIVRRAVSHLHIPFIPPAAPARHAAPAGR